MYQMGGGGGGKGGKKLLGKFFKIKTSEMAENASKFH